MDGMVRLTISGTQVDDTDPGGALALPGEPGIEISACVPALGGGGGGTDEPAIEIRGPGEPGGRGWPWEPGIEIPGRRIIHIHNPPQVPKGRRHSYADGRPSTRSRQRRRVSASKRSPSKTICFTILLPAAFRLSQALTSIQRMFPSEVRITNITG